MLRADYDAAAIAARYEAHGAAAISVLTEPTFFDGSLDDLRAVRGRVSVPLLRKDFVIDEYQLFEARAAGADAVLLIVAALEPSGCRRLHAAARANWGSRCWSRSTIAAELDVALSASPRVIGVNNRNLRTLAVDPAASLDLVVGDPGRRGGRRGERAAPPRRPAPPARRAATTRSWWASGWCRARSRARALSELL